MSLSRLVAASALLLAPLLQACNAHPVHVGWTVDGRAAGDACAETGGEVRITVVSRDAEGAEAREEQVVAPCASGEASVAGGNLATVFLELVAEGRVVGSGGPVSLEPRAGGAAAQAEIDIEVSAGRLEAELLVGGRSCGDVGASSFDVVLARSTVSADLLVLEETAVPCEGGRAVYGNPFVKVGARHFLYARTVVGEEAWATSRQGQGIDVDRPLVRTSVNLRTEARAPDPDAGPIVIGDGGPVVGIDAGAEDAGEVDGGEADGGEADAGEADGGTTADGGAPTDDAGTADAGTLDAGMTDDDAGTPDGGRADGGAPPVDGGTTDGGAPPVDGGTTDGGAPPGDAGTADGGGTDAGG